MNDYNNNSSNAVILKRKKFIKYDDSYFIFL